MSCRVAEWSLPYKARSPTAAANFFLVFSGIYNRFFLMSLSTTYTGGCCIPTLTSSGHWILRGSWAAASIQLQLDEKKTVTCNGRLGCDDPVSDMMERNSSSNNAALATEERDGLPNSEFQALKTPKATRVSSSVSPSSAAQGATKGGSFRDLFYFADAFDHFLLASGCLMAAAAGGLYPCTCYDSV